MPGLTLATEAQKASVDDMIRKMMTTTAKPPNMSFTMGWDVVASYSEAQINKLLAERHKVKDNNLLQDLNVVVENYDKRRREKYNSYYRVKFGPPLLQFDPTAVNLPQCSIQMEIISGTTQFGDNDAPEDIDPGWTLKLHNIPLATARGELSPGGTITGNPQLLPGEKAVHLDFDQQQTQHVVLGFEMNKSKLVVEAIPPANLNMYEKENIATQSDFQDAFKEFFAGKQGDTETPPRSLSYSIASVNNKRNEEAIDLTPQRFQFATYFGDGPNRDMRLISIFIQVKGSLSQGRTDSLQPKWIAQWVDAATPPVPKGFSASLILSSALFNQLILAKGFAKSNWTVKDISPGDQAVNKIECRNSAHFNIDEQNHEYAATSVFHVDAVDIPLKDHPMYLTIRQDDLRGNPTIEGFWEIKKTIGWEARWKTLGLGDRKRQEGGNINGIWHLCDEKDHSKYRKLDKCKFTVTDEAFSLDWDLNTSGFRFDQSEGNAIQFDAWQNGMRGLWTKAPSVSVSAFGIGFLRTTNLLLPGSNVIDINEGIGLKVPKDLVLVGDVEKQ